MESLFLTFLILVPALLLGTLCGIISIVTSDSGSATSRRAGWALAIIWLMPIILIAAVFLGGFWVGAGR